LPSVEFGSKNDSFNSFNANRLAVQSVDVPLHQFIVKFDVDKGITKLSIFAHKTCVDDSFV
jgi:hypothetical protein